MEIMPPPVFSCRTCAKVFLAVVFSLDFLYGTFRENGHFVSLSLSLILFQIPIMLKEP